MVLPLCRSGSSKGLLEATLLLGKKQIPNLNRPCHQPGRLCPRSGQGASSGSVLTGRGSRRHRSPAPSEATPPHPGPAASPAPRRALANLACKLPLPAMPAAFPQHTAPISPLPKSNRHARHLPGTPRPVLPPGYPPPAPPPRGLTAGGCRGRAESSHPAQAEADGGQERLPPHLASSLPALCRGRKVSGGWVKFWG